MNSSIKVLMCGSKLSVGGGMVAVIEKYLNYKDWNDVKITYIPTHVDKNVFVKYLFYATAYIKIFFITLFKHFDIAHLHTTDNGSFFRKAYLLRLLKKRGIKVVLHHHTDYNEFYSHQTENKKRFINETFEKADLNVVLGKVLADFIRNKCQSANVEVVYNAVHVYEKNPYNVNATYVMFMGWFLERKGIFDFLEAIRRLDSILDENVRFVLCGEGEQTVYEKIVELGIRKRIAHIGWVTEKQRNEFFKNTFVNVLPSYREALPMTILESMAYGIPNIATNIAAIPEVIVDGVNGHLIEPGRVEDIVKYIMMLSSNKEYREKLSSAAYNTINERFSINVHIAAIDKIYCELIQGKK